MTKKEEFYVIKMDITDENYYTYWRLWCTEEQAEEIVSNRQREYGYSKVSLYIGDEEDKAQGETHLIDEDGQLWTKTIIKVKN